jgi:hypothetical protein
MKKLKIITAMVLTAAVVAGPLTGLADDKKAEKAKPYPLKTCIVSDEELGKMGKPYVFTHEGQEIKMCCKDCLKDFNKEPAKYLKKIADAEKKPAKK